MDAMQELTGPEPGMPPEVRTLALYRQYGARLYGYALGILGQPADAEDVVQEAFLRLDGHLRNGGADDNPGGWLFRVATNLSRDQQRRRARDGGAPSERGGPGASALTRIALERVLAGLPARDRELVLLRGFGLTYAEIATALELRPSSVGTLLARAVQRFTTAYVDEIGTEA